MTLQLTQAEHEALVKAIDSLPGIVDSSAFDLVHQASVQYGNIVTVCYIDISRLADGAAYGTSISFEDTEI